jgi:hypothetical protein
MSFSNFFFVLGDDESLVRVVPEIYFNPRNSCNYSDFGQPIPKTNPMHVVDTGDGCSAVTLLRIHLYPFYHASLDLPKRKRRDS